MSTSAVASSNYTGKNLLINSGFIINNGNAGVPYVSAATLVSGATGHECWKAGTGGGDYSFTQLKSNTQITISASKTLIQVIEDVNIQGTTYTLSWTGTAQARYAVNSATPSGSYVSSPIVITGQTVGTTMSVEFNSGTLSNPQLELGTVATGYGYKSYQQELQLTQRYAEIFWTNAFGVTFVGQYTNPTSFWNNFEFKQAKRAVPTFTLVNGAWTVSTPNVYPTVDGLTFYYSTSFYLTTTANLVAAMATARL